jgi:hypothetical protein
VAVSTAAVMARSFRLEAAATQTQKPNPTAAQAWVRRRRGPADTAPLNRIKVTQQ